MRRYWDANAFLGILKAEDGKVEMCRAILEEAKAGDCTVVTSVISFIEVLHYGDRSTMTQELENEIRTFFEYPFIEVHEVDRRIAERARSLMWQHTTLKTRDSIHVATAVLGSVDTLETYDDNHLTPLDGQIPKEEGGLLRICHPHTENVPAMYPDAGGTSEA